MRRLSPAAPLRLPLSAPLSAVSTVRGAASPMPPSQPPLSGRPSPTAGPPHAGQSMQPPVSSLRGNCRSWRSWKLPPSAQNAQSPLPALVLPSSPSHLSQIRRLDQPLPPPGNLRPQNRSDAADSGHAAAPSILLVAHQKTGGRAQDVFLLLTPHLWTKKCWSATPLYILCAHAPMH